MKNIPHNVRHRKGKKESSSLTLNECSDKCLKKSDNLLPNWWAYAILVIGILSLELFSRVNKCLPRQLTLNDEFTQPERFIGQRAEFLLKRLTDIGVKVVGSYENEVLAVDFLQREISFVVQQAEKIHKIETDIQKPTGSYYLSLKPHNFRNYYANIQNIVVKFSSSNSSTDSVLVNCHYDTVPESPGASDNGLNCAVMLEVLTKLSKLKKPLHNTVIFLFNGAEENPLQASHGFITQHKWSKSVRAVINLDSAGAGGKEVLFQTTSAFPWLVQMYAESAPYPNGGVQAEELFLSGIIPSDTDFRIFRDFGQVPGLDLAHIQNGYVYHTKFDKMEFIQPGTFQHTGDNVLGLVTKLGSSPELGKLFQPEKKDNWRVVYFDIFGLYMIVYSELSAIVWNVVVSIASIFAIYRVLTLVSDSRNPLIEMLFAGASQLGGWILAAVMLILISKVLDVFNSTMSWYNHPYYIIPLYVLPLMFTSALLPVMNRILKPEENPEIMAIRYMNGSQLLWTVLLIALTVLRVRTSFIIMFIVLFSTVASLAATFFSKYFSGMKYIALNFIMMIFPVAFVLYQAVRTFTTIIPMTARMGPHSAPELIISALVVIFCILSTSFAVPLILILRKPKRLLVGLCTLHIAAIIVIAATPLGFPYSGEVTNPALQRYYILHCERTFYDSRGNVRKTDSGIFVQSLDRNNINYVSKVVPELQGARSAAEECVSELGCGVPVFTSRFINPAPYGYWVKASAPVIHHPTGLQIISQTPVDVRTRKIRFSVTGPDHITILISPRVGVRLVKWSFDDGEPKIAAEWMNRYTYMVYYSHGLMGGTLLFDLYLEVDQKLTVSDSILDIAVVGHYMHDKSFRTAEFEKFLSQFPDWAHLTPWTTTYKSWVV